MNLVVNLVMIMLRGSCTPTQKTNLVTVKSIRNRGWGPNAYSKKNELYNGVQVAPIFQNRYHIKNCLPCIIKYYMDLVHAHILQVHDNVCLVLFCTFVY